MFRRFDLRRRIREWRRVLAESQNREAYWIFDDATLDDVVDKLPRTKHELLECYGMGPRRVNLYGSFILGAIQKYKQDPNNARWINELGILHKSNDWDGLQVMKHNSNEGDDFVKHEQLPLLTLSSPQKIFNSINKQKAEEKDSKPHAVAIKEEYDAAAVAIKEEFDTATAAMKKEHDTEAAVIKDEYDAVTDDDNKTQNINKISLDASESSTNSHKESGNYERPPALV